jgi:hypothetical protein
MATFTPEQFGAVGNGVTDDTSAFLDLSAAVNSDGGGTIILRSDATYRVGRQAPASGYYQLGIACLDLRNCAGVVIEGNGATLKHVDGLKFGTFNPSTGMPQDYGVPYSVIANAATAGVLIQCLACTKVTIRDVNLDGNSQGAVIGGRFGDTGRQLIHYGIYVRGWGQALLENVDARHFLLDCYGFSHPGLTAGMEAVPVTLLNCRGSYAGRNVVSNVGSKGMRTFNCVFSRGGEASATVTVPSAGAFVSSAPASCWDDEAEDGAEIRDVRHFGSSFLSGPYSNTAYVADSGPTAGITHDSCLFDGTLWVRKPGWSLLNSTVHGRLVFQGGYSHRDDNALIQNCEIDDVPMNGSGPISGLLLDGQGAGIGYVIRDTRIRCTTTLLNLRLAGHLSGEIIWQTGTTHLADLGNAILLNGANIQDLSIVDEIAANAPATGYRVEYPASASNAKLISANGRLKWENASTGYSGQLANSRYASYDPPSISAHGTFEVEIAFQVPVSGPQARVLPNFQNLPEGLILSARATSATQGYLRFQNFTAGAIDPAAGEIRVSEVL